MLLATRLAIVNINVTLRRVPIVAFEKAISIMYFECVSVSLVIRQATRMCRISICALAGSTTFFQVIS
jgi:hypothetical protein